MSDAVVAHEEYVKGSLRRELRSPTAAMALNGREPRRRVIIVALGTAAIVYTLYKQVWPKPAYPYDLFLLIIAGWAVAGAAITIAFPKLTARIGRGFSESEGLRADT